MYVGGGDIVNETFLERKLAQFRSFFGGMQWSSAQKCYQSSAAWAVPKSQSDDGQGVLRGG